MRALEGRLAKLEAATGGGDVTRAVHILAAPDGDGARAKAALIEAGTAKSGDFFILLCAPEGFQRQEVALAQTH